MKTTVTKRKYGHWTVVGKTIKKKGHLLLPCKCKCGKEKIVRKDQLENGKSKSCGCAKSDRFKTRDPAPAILKRVYKDYRINAKRRGFDFSLTLEEFKTIASRPCIYCGATDTRASDKKRIISKGTIKLNGLDRLKNEKGYTKNNIASCCSDCNFIKSHRNYKEFISWLDRVVDYRKGLK